MKRSLTTLVVFIFVSLALSACVSKSFTVTNVWARPGLSGSNSAIYMTINNPSQADALVEARCDVAATVELHMTTMESGVMKMQAQDSIALPVNGQVKLEPGGLHVMLINLRRDLKAGDQFPVTLRFQHAQEMTLQVQVKEP
jgi:copper(I)-binding protein